MLIKRIITGLVGMIIAVYVINFGDWVFSAAIVILALTAWHEYYRAFSYMGMQLTYFGGMTAVFFTIACAWQGNSDELLAVIMFATLLILSKAVLCYGKFTIQQACISIAGICYIALSFAHLILLRFTGSEVFIHSTLGDISLGCAFVWLAFIGTWASDTFAFFAGSLFGKTKLCPQISPGKTVEGFIGGILGTALSLIGLGILFNFSLIHMGILGVLIALVATVGDLVESSFKRLTGIKDSGQILPGHGGVLDRFDSIMFTVPFVYYYVQIFKIF